MVLVDLLVQMLLIQKILKDIKVQVREEEIAFFQLVKLIIQLSVEVLVVVAELLVIHKLDLNHMDMLDGQVDVVVVPIDMILLRELLLVVLEIITQLLTKLDILVDRVQLLHLLLVDGQVLVVAVVSVVLVVLVREPLDLVTLVEQVVLD